MTNIDLIKNRKPGDSILVTWSFIRQEFIPLFRYFVALCLPFIMFGQILHYLILAYVYTSNVNSDVIFVGQVVWSVVMGFMLIYWIQLFALSYIRVYQDKRLLSGGKQVALPEVLKVMSDKLRTSLACCLYCTAIVGVASCFLLLPGIYLGVGLAFMVYYIILKDAPLNVIFKSIRLIRGIWWKAFGYLLILTLVAGAIAYLLLPAILNAAFTIFTGDFFSEYDIVLFALLGTITGCLLMIVLFIALGVRFFTLCNRKENRIVLNQISEWGPE